MKGRFEYKKLPKYPHMKPADIEIWERFIDSHPDFFDTVDYDVQVGEGADFPVDFDGRKGASAMALYKKKIDVVGYEPAAITLIEIKPSASVMAVGQVSVYDDIYITERRPAEPVRNILLTDRINPDVEALAKRWDVIVIVV